MSAQLPHALIGNAFNILGLSSLSSLKETRKRAQQLLQLAKIEETQEFDSDIGHVRELRSEDQIRLAMEKVTGIKDRLCEIFFWFDEHSVESQKAIFLISGRDYLGALRVLEGAEKGKADWLSSKNLALALMFDAFAASSLTSLLRSLELWKRISQSEDFWSFYQRHYLLHDELGTSASIFEEFGDSITEILSSQVAAFYRQTKNPEAIGVFRSIFGTVGKPIDIEIIHPIVLKIKNEMDELEIITQKHSPDAELVRRILNNVNKSFLELEKLELSDYSPLTVLRED